MAIIKWNDPDARRAYARDKAYTRYHGDEEYRKAISARNSAALVDKLARLKSKAAAGNGAAQSALAQHREKDKLRKREERAAKR